MCMKKLGLLIATLLLSGCLQIGIKDCGSDMTCMENALKSCTPARFYSQEYHDIFQQAYPQFQLTNPACIVTYEGSYL